MVLKRLKRSVWRVLVRVHGDVRVAALLRALSVVGMVGGMAGFVIGINPVFAAAVVAQGIADGPALPKMGVVGLVVYSVSYAYYSATRARVRTDEGLIRL